MEIKLQLNHSYLVRFGSGDTISSVTLLLETDKAYHIRWNRGLNSNDTWELKRQFDNYYTIEEDISDFVVEEKVERKLLVETTNVLCNFCGGLGTVDDSYSTSGKKMCPKCNGSKMVVEVVKITE